MKKRIGLIRAAVGVLALAVLGPAIAQSQIIVICGIYRDSYADTGANLCHGHGPGCMECTILMFKGDGGGTPIDPPSQGTTLASYASGSDRVLEPGQPVTLALDTGLAPMPQKLSACEGPSLYDRVRMASRERVAPIVKDRSRSRLMEQVSAR